MTVIPFADWLPDIAPLGNQGVLTALNVLPQAKGYRYSPSLVVYPGPGALAARVIGAFAAKDKSANTYNYAANVGASNASKLYVLSSVTWTDKSGNGADGTSGYSVADGAVWEFVKWGETVIACTISEPVQSIAFGAGAFADLMTSTRKPKAKHIAVARDFVILGNLNDDVGAGADGLVPSRVWWSGINDSATFEEGGTTSQSDFQDLQSGGAVQSIVGGEYGTVFCETSIWRMTYVGAPIVWQFDEIERDRGVFVPGSVARSGKLTFFLDRDGWYMWDGAQSTSIGVNKIDKYFLADFDPTFKHRVSAVCDPVNHIFFCAYPSVSADGGIPDKVLAYDWVTQRWSISEIDVEWMYRAFSEGYTLDSLDTLSGSIDALTTTLDSPIYQGQNILFGAFNTDHKLATFTGTALSATIDTGEAQLSGPGGQYTLVTSARPLVDGATTIAVAPYTRNLQTESVTAGSASTVNTIGECPLRSNARFHRFRTTVTGPFTAALGIEIPPEAVAATGNR